MAYKIIITEAFERSAAKTSEWITTNWSLLSAEKFDKKIMDIITSIILSPKSGRQSGRKNIRSRMVTKHNRIYYKFIQNTITILELFETKTNPKNNKYEKF